MYIFFNVHGYVYHLLCFYSCDPLQKEGWRPTPYSVTDIPLFLRNLLSPSTTCTLKMQATLYTQTEVCIYWPRSITFHYAVICGCYAHVGWESPCKWKISLCVCVCLLCAHTCMHAYMRAYRCGWVGLCTHMCLHACKICFCDTVHCTNCSSY